VSSTACKLRISGIEPESIVDGPGFRYAIFTQGCPHACLGCHNPETHPFEGGTWMTVEELLAAIRKNPLLAGATFSGGEPFCQCKPLVALAEGVHNLGKTVVCYTGYTLEQLVEKGKKEPAVLALLQSVDTLIDGPYIEAERDLTLSFRGSANQRVLTREEIRQCIMHHAS